VDSPVHEKRASDRHFYARSKVGQSKVISIFSYMQAVFANRWAVNCFPTDFCVCVSHHNIHVVSRAGAVRLLKFSIE
jgi:hypothetical protein